MVKRVPRQPKAGRPKQESRPVWQQERHSGEGSASALETLHRLERSRSDSLPADVPPEEPGEDD